MSKNEQLQSEYVGLITPSDVEYICDADSGGCGRRFWRAYGAVMQGCEYCRPGTAMRTTGRIMASTLQPIEENKVSRGQGKRKVALTTRRDADTEHIYKLLCDIPA